MELLGGWNRVRRNLVGAFFLQAKADVIESEIPQPEEILLQRQTYWLPSTELEREYRELAELDSLLEETRNDYTDKQKQFELRWQLCFEKNELFQKLVSGFDSYYNVSKSKQAADRKINEKYDWELDDITRKVNRLKKELACMHEVKAELEVRLKKAKIYREFMNLVVEESNGEFEEISHVIARYNELKSIRERYVEKTVKQVQLAFELEKELKEIFQAYKTEEVACETYQSKLDDYKNQLQVSTWRRQDNLLALKDGLRREILVANVPKMALHSLYLVLCQEMKQPVTLKETQFKEQLQFIQRFLKELVKLSDKTSEFLSCPSDIPLASRKSGDRGTRKNRAKSETKISKK